MTQDTTGEEAFLTGISTPQPDNNKGKPDQKAPANTIKATKKLKPAHTPKPTHTRRPEQVPTRKSKETK